MLGMELTQVRLIVSDFAACFRFYRDVLGLKPQFDDDRGPYAKFSPDEGTAGIALHSRADLARSVPALAEAAGDRALVVLKIADVDGYAAEITARGATLIGEPTVMWERLRVAYLRDPEGNLIELQQWLAPR
jgi:catechol 2,3-dioxygenase-like lactoylglutathione lyase family enzyme